ncbi:MAG: hypothetical protein HC819_22035 [Cyclobacteriaceae bacterium]|nr:hypothetical protein [Cyclobacteriaceae bacterium]
MNKNINNEEFVSQYLDNTLSEIDRLDFENKLLKDADLREEYSLQKEIINGIKEARRLELKSRLSNITISTPLYQTVAFKALTAVTLTAGLGVGIYLMLNDNDKVGISQVDLSQYNAEIIQQEEVMPEVPKSIEPIIEKNTEIESQTPKDSAEEAVVAKRNVKTPEPVLAEPNVIQPDVVAPADEEYFEQTK